LIYIKIIIRPGKRLTLRTKPRYGCTLAQPIAVEYSGCRCGQVATLIDEQTERLARTCTTQLHVRQIGLSHAAAVLNHRLIHCGNGLFSSFALATHAAATQSFNTGFELMALYDAVRGVCWHRQEISQLHMVAHSL